MMWPVVGKKMALQKFRCYFNYDYDHYYDFFIKIMIMILG